MSIEVPTPEAVRAALAPLTMKQIDRLAQLSGVPATTIYKIQRGETDDPRLGTVGRFLPLIDRARSSEALPPTASNPEADPQPAGA